MRETGLFWGLKNCRVAQFCRCVTKCILSSHVSQISGCRRKDPLRVSNREVSPCSSETNDCAKVGTVSCSLSRPVRSDRKRRAGHSDQPIDISVRLHLCVAVIRNQSKRFHTFVANRLSVIHENSASHQWRYVNSELNPADEVTRGLTVDEIRASSKWLNGPEFLKNKEEFWASDPTIHQPELSDDDLEIKREIQLNNQLSTCRAGEEVLSRLIERYSAWDRLRSSVAWLLRFKSWFIERHCHSSITSRLQIHLEMGPLLSVEEVKYAESELSSTYKGYYFQTSLKPCKESVLSSLHAK